jgi:Ca-activated chloride channel family protein
MSGFPIEKAKETMKLALDSLYPYDTFNLITFAGDEHILFPQPVPATKENLEKAQRFLETREGSGGTEMMKAIKASMDPSDKQDHVRIVCFMTDGYVGNDMEIIGEVQKHPNARVFSFGIGGSVNRFLLDNMAKYGRGEVEYVGLNDDGSAAAKRFHERVRNPLLTDLSVDWNGMPVSDVYPKTIPDLFSAKPVILTGKYAGNGKGVIRLRGKMSGRDFVRDIPVDFSSTEQHDVLATLWARTRVDDLMGQDMNGMQQGTMKDELKQAITQLGLDYRIMTQFTSFVAVEEMIVTEGGQPRRIDVPVEVPEGVDRNAVFGETSAPINGRNFQGLALLRSANQSGASSAKMRRASGGGGGGYGTGRGGNVGGTTVNASAGTGTAMSPTPAPPPKPASNLIVDGADKDEALRVLSPEERKRADMQSKLHPSILKVIDWLKAPKAGALSDEAKFVRDGKAEIQIFLTEKSDATMAELKKLGFEVVLEPKTAKLVIGRLPVEKLAALSELKFVRYVSPQMNK